jgi:hypothetical protein
MHDTLAGGIIEGATTFKTDLDDIFAREQTLRVGKLRQASPRHVFHNDIIAIRAYFRIEDWDNVRVHKLSSKRSLIQELPAENIPLRRILEHVGINQLYGNFGISKGIDSKIYRAQGALAEQLFDLVFTNALEHRLPLTDLQNRQ